MAFSKRTPSLLVPAILLPIAAVLTLAHRLSDSLSTALDAAPILVFGAGALLGIWTRRGRLVVGVVVLALANCALVNVGGRSLFDAVALLLPLNIALVVWLSEAHPFTGRGAVLFAITFLQVAVVAWLQNFRGASPAAALEQPVAAAGIGVWTSLPDVAVFAYAAALGLVVTRALLHKHALAVGAAWALVASFLALDAISTGGPASVHFATAGLLLLFGATWDPKPVVAMDTATGLPTRMEFQRALRRMPRRYAIALVEIDDFPTFRQSHGPKPTHRMLWLVARQLKKLTIARSFHLDGPTFAMIFPGPSRKRAARHLDAVRRTVEGLTVDLSFTEPTPQGRPVRVINIVERTVSVTVSIGLAECTVRGTDPKSIVEAAERALQHARESGMNCVST